MASFIALALVPRAAVADATLASAIYVSAAAEPVFDVRYLALRGGLVARYGFPNVSFEGGFSAGYSLLSRSDVRMGFGGIAFRCYTPFAPGGSSDALREGEDANSSCYARPTDHTLAWFYTIAFRGGAGVVEGRYDGGFVSLAGELGIRWSRYFRTYAFASVSAPLVSIPLGVAVELGGSPGGRPP